MGVALWWSLRRSVHSSQRRQRLPKCTCSKGAPFKKWIRRALSDDSAFSAFRQKSDSRKCALDRACRQCRPWSDSLTGYSRHRASWRTTSSACRWGDAAASAAAANAALGGAGRRKYSSLPM